MSSTQEGSTGAACNNKKTERNRRVWTQIEEQTLIATLKELIAQGWKSDNGFRPGYLRRAEIALKKAIPNCDVKAMPHINSRISSWKRFYNSLSQILSRSGLGFNTRGTHMIECEDDQWEQVLKADPNARGMRYKQWPYYDDWQEIFGKDRANGENAEDIYEAYATLNSTNEEMGSGTREVLHDYDDISAEFDSLSQSGEDGTRACGAKAGKKRKTEQDLSRVCKLLAEMNHATNSRLEHIANRIGYEFDMGKARQEVLDQLGAIEGLSVENKFKVCEMVAFNDKRLDIWRAMKLEARIQYVEHLLGGHGV